MQKSRCGGAPTQRAASTPYPTPEQQRALTNKQHCVVARRGAPRSAEHSARVVVEGVECGVEGHGHGLLLHCGHEGGLAFGGGHVAWACRGPHHLGARGLG